MKLVHLVVHPRVFVYFTPRKCVCEFRCLTVPVAPTHLILGVQHHGSLRGDANNMVVLLRGTEGEVHPRRQVQVEHRQLCQQPGGLGLLGGLCPEALADVDECADEFQLRGESGCLWEGRKVCEKVRNKKE